jgi:putative NIF3 family GTP cyclohydrolase 1 type 2
MPQRPSHAAVTRFVSTLLPPKANDVELLYHTPRHPKYDAEHARADQIVLSVTPTPGVYDIIGYEAARVASTIPGAILPRPPRTVCFLHRPFTLDRRRVRRGTLVLSSHTAFDEIITTGWNVALAGRLTMNVEESVCIQGYKGDPERKIGIVGQVSMPRGVLESRIKQEFGAVEAVFEGAAEDIQVVAIMNAFNAGEVQRVLEMAQERGWIQAGELAGRHVLYLTGQPRESGVFAARESGMSVVCVGHRSAEEWGIRFMAATLRVAFPGVSVKEVYEEEVLQVREPKRKDLATSTLGVQDLSETAATGQA